MQNPWNDVHLKTNTFFFRLCGRGVITGVTANFYTLTHTEQSQLIGKHVFRFLNPDESSVWKTPQVNSSSGPLSREFYSHLTLGNGPGFKLLVNLNQEDPGGWSGAATLLKNNPPAAREMHHQEILRSTLQSIDDLVFVVDAQGCFTECYPASEGANLHFSSDLFAGRNFHEVGFPAEASQKFLRAIQRAKGTGKTQQIQYTLEVFGSRFFYQARISPRYNSEGEFEGATAICRDITSLKKIEKQLTESRNYYLSILQKLPSMIWRAGRNGQCDFFNLPYLDFTGQTTEFLSGFGWTQCLHPEEKHQVVESFMEAFREKKTFRQEYRLLHHSGQYRWVIGVGKPVFTLQNEFSGFIGSCTDIHQEKNNQRLLEESEKRYRNIVELHSDLVVRWRPDQTVTFVNKPLCRMFRKLPAELLNQRFIDFFPENQRPMLWDSYHQMIAQPRLHVTEVNFVDPEGHSFWIQWVCSPIYDSSGRVIEFQSVGRDITRQKLEEKEKEKLLNNLNRKVQEQVFLNRFSTLIHHPGVSLHQVLDHLVKKLPGVFSPNVFCFARIQYGQRKFLSPECLDTSCCMKEGFGQGGMLYLFYELNEDTVEDRHMMVDEMGRFLGIICDMLETFVNQQEAEQQLETSRQKYLELFESITDIVFIMDGQGRFTSINPAMESILGYNLNHELSYRNIIVPSALHEVQRRFAESVSNLQPSISFETEIIDSQGAIRNFLINCLIKYRHQEPLEVLGVARDVTESRQMTRRMIKAIMETEERERKRFAEELHDGLGPLLSGIKMYLQKAGASEKLDAPESQIIQYSSQLINDAIDQTRMIANNLMPNVLADFGILQALKSYAEKINQLGSLAIQVVSDHQRIDLQPNESLVVYRVLTELINNALKHSQADTINIQFIWNNHVLQVIYHENGSTIHPDRIIINPDNKGMGLKNIMNRIDSINGIIRFNPGNTEGFQVKIIFASQKDN